MHQLSDIDLVLKAQAGESSAIAILYDRHHLRIYKYVRARLYDTQTAHDVTGEIFLRMVANIQSYKPMDVPFTAWLYRIAHNYLVNHIQKEQQAQRFYQQKQMFSGNHAQANPQLVVEEKIESEAILAVLNALEETQRDVLILRFIVGLSLQEVADSLDKTVAAVKSVQHRGLKAMKALLL
jgi:RNA polymerase sigma-70 factor (ECF subfamily)